MLKKSPEQHWRGIVSIALALFLLTTVASSQISDRVGRITSGNTEHGQSISIKVELLQASTLEKIEIAYRQFGMREFSRAEMSITTNIATVNLPPEASLPPFLEYYLILYYSGKELPETFPVENPEQAPLRITIQPTLQEKSRIIILSPDPGESINIEDLLISVSLSQFEFSTTNQSVKLFIDDIDISSGILRYGDLIVVRPQNIDVTLPEGPHQSRVYIFDSTGIGIDSVTWSFSIKRPVSEMLLAPTTVMPLRYYGSIQLETRQENISASTTPYNRATISANGSYKDYQLRSYLYLTNEEKNYRQPQNRFLIVAEAPWLKLGYGDHYPTMPDLIMSGKRLRGFFANLTQEKFSLDIASGTVTRKINGLISTPFPDSLLSSEQSGDPGATFQLYDTTSGNRQWIKLKPGTYERDLFVVHPIFGKRLGTHWGFTYLKSKDDINSIQYGIRPRENAVFGTDVLLSFDRQNFEIIGQAAFSAVNNDITKGSFTDDDIDSIYYDSDEGDRRNIKNLRDFFSNIITVNENLIPLNAKNIPTLSYEGGIGLNYFNNTFRFIYLRHGESYESFGHTYLRPDVEGFSITDRLRLLKNQIFLSTGYERLHDNTSGAKPFTMNTNTANISISYMPIINFPNITLSYLYSSNKNSAEITDSVFSINDITNRVLFHVGKEVTYLARHNLYFTFGTSLRNDHTPKDMDTRSTTVGLGSTSTFEFPLQTTFNLTINSNRIARSINEKTTITYTTIYASGQYQLMNKTMTLTGSLSPTFGNIERYLVSLGAQYKFWEYLTARTEIYFYFNQKSFNNMNPTNDIVWTFSIRAEI